MSMDQSSTTDERHQKVVVVGAGHAAGRMAEALRLAGYPGSITLIGEENWPPYERPALSKELLAGDSDIERLFVRPQSWYAENNVRVMLGRPVASINRQASSVRLSDGEMVGYDKLVLATGARARRLPIVGNDLPGVYYVRHIADTLALQERLVPGARILIIGAGFIGLEVAAIASKRQCEVMIVESGAYPLARVASREIGDFFGALHRRHGATLRNNTSIIRIERVAGTLTAFASDGENWQGDVIVAGIGAAPNTELAEAAGLAVDNGVVTDEYGLTSDANVYAIGDVTSHFNPLLGRRVRLETWQNAQNQAIAVANIIAGGYQAYSEIPWFWTDQHEVNFQMAGVPQLWDEIVLRGELEAGRCSIFYLNEGKVVGGATLNNGKEMRIIKQLIAHGVRADRSILRNVSLRLDNALKQAMTGR